jgi:dephospho-CoA kinase
MPPRRSRSRYRPPKAKKTSPGNSTTAARTPADLRVTALTVGLTGPNASGKGEVARHLASLGFRVVSLSDVVREEATRRGLDHMRDTLIRTGNELRALGGPGALARAILSRLEGRAVVDSIRNPGEVEVLRRGPRFVLIGVDAPQRLRFERSMLRGRAGDGATLAEFAAKEARENSATEAGQQLLATLALADIVIQNDGTIAELRAHVDAALGSRAAGTVAARKRSARPTSRSGSTSTGSSAGAAGGTGRSAPAPLRSPRCERTTRRPRPRSRPR